MEAHCVSLVYDRAEENYRLREISIGVAAPSALNHSIQIGGAVSAEKTAYQRAQTDRREGRWGGREQVSYAEVIASPRRGGCVSEGRGEGRSELRSICPIAARWR